MSQDEKRTNQEFATSGLERGPDHRQSTEIVNAPPVKIRYGAPDGPRPKCTQAFDAGVPRPYAGHEAAAQFLATPKSLRAFPTVTALAKHFGVTRKTVYCWMNDSEVMERADWLSRRNKRAGDLIARREWPTIMERAVAMAKRGDLQAMKFVASQAWGDELQSNSSHVEATISIEDLLPSDESHQPQDLLDEKKLR